MGLTSALSTSLSGLDSNQSKLDVIGNNIANVNTVGFKSSSLDFKSQFSQTFSFGSAPDADLGGTNPIQIGLGVSTGDVSRNFATGSTNVTGVESNLAIQGDGFFIVKDSTQQAYTRDGSFKLNSSNELVNSSGQRVQAFGVDGSYNIVPGVLQNVTIPLGTLTITQPTTAASVTDSLNSNGDLPSTVSDVASQDLFVSNGAGGVTGTAPTAATLLTDISDSAGNTFFPSGQTITFGGRVGGASTATNSLAITPTTTLGDLMTFMNGTLGINTTAGANGTVVTTPGAALAAGTAAGSADLNIFGNVGKSNNIVLSTSSLTVSGSANPNPITWNQAATADGESAVAVIPVYDSLGNPLTANVTISLMSKTATGGTVWQYYATSPDSTGSGTAANTAIGMGTLTFDANGAFVSAAPGSVTINRTGTGAQPALSFPIDFSKIQAVNSASQLTGSADGSLAGTLTSYTIADTGVITGNFSNGQKRSLGQIALATFRNNQGLVDEGNNLFQSGPNSGTASITAPGGLAAGTITAGALELSNVDLSAEFVQLISASTGFSASSRVITTSNQLLQELLQAGR